MHTLGIKHMTSVSLFQKKCFHMKVPTPFVLVSFHRDNMRSVIVCGSLMWIPKDQGLVLRTLLKTSEIK